MTMRGALDEAGQEIAVAAPRLAAPHHHDSGHEHAAPRRRRRFGEWLFLASAFDRLLLAILVVALIWLAVVWAMG